MVLDMRRDRVGIATGFFLALAACQDNSESLSRSEVEQIAADQNDDSQVLAKIGELGTRIAQLEERMAQLESTKQIPVTSSSPRPNSNMMSYRLIGSDEPLSYSTLERCQNARATIEADYQARQAAAPRGLFYSPPQLSCVSVG